MASVKVIFGSTNGNTKNAAMQIAQELKGDAIDVAMVKDSDFNADLVILGTSTWGVGELQDDWLLKPSLLNNVDWKGRTVALFGLGDQCGFGDTFIDGVRDLYDRVIAGGAVVIGTWSTCGYLHSSSRAEVDGDFVGLALDEDNQPEQSGERIKTWCQQVVAEAGLQ